jgi:hypothetical protein
VGRGNAADALDRGLGMMVVAFDNDQGRGGGRVKGGDQSRRN